MENHLLKELSERLAKITPMAEEFRDETRTRIEQVLKKSLQDLDVLTQEEFAVHSQALARAEQRIAELERSLQEMEAKLNAIQSSP